MKKIILSLDLFGAMTNVSAKMVVLGVEITSHQTWTTGNASGHVEDNNGVFFLQQVLWHQRALSMGKFIKIWK